MDVWIDKAAVHINTFR